MKHPIQTIVMDDKVARFQKNKIVEFLLDAYRPGMNGLARLAATGDFDADDQQQFAMLIGYSVSGFGGLSYADPEVVAEADAIVQTLVPPTSSKSMARLEAERAGYVVVPTAVGYQIQRKSPDRFDIPRDALGNEIAFDDEERAWLAAWMFEVGHCAGFIDGRQFEKKS